MAKQVLKSIWKRLMEKDWKFLHTWLVWVSTEIRQPQGSLVCVDMLPSSINVSCHTMEQIEENMFKLVTAKNQGAFAMGIRNKWKLCLKNHSCSSIAIFSISSSVRTLSCWDNWEGFHISASSKITDVHVNKGKHACTSYLMPSSLDIKEYHGKPFNISVLLLFFPPPSLFLFQCEGIEKLVHFKNMFSWFYLRNTEARSYCQLREVQEGKKKSHRMCTQVFLCNIGKENAKLVHGSAEQSVHFQESCPRSFSVPRFVKLCGVPCRS